MNTLFRSLAVLSVVALTTVTALAGPLKKGDSFPKLAKLEGTVPDLEGKVVLVDFWASWCGPCKRSFPALKELHERFGKDGLVVIAISLDEDKADMNAFLKKTPVPFTILRDPKSKLAERVGVESIPMGFILDRTGKVHDIHIGFDPDKTPGEYAAAIAALLGK